MPNPVDNLIAGFRDLVEQVPDFAQPLIIAVAGAVPFIEAEGATAVGVIGGLHPVVAGSAAIAGNLACVVLVVLLSSRIRTAALARRTPLAVEPAKLESKGRQKVGRWLVRFGVPGASLLGPLAIPTHFTAATLVAAGVSSGRVILWQAIAIFMWGSLITAVATGFLVSVEV